VLLLSGTYETLIDYAMVALWVFYALMVLGVILLRRSRPDLARPYKMWGYPITPVFFVAVATFFIVNAAVNRPAPSLASLGLIATGVPVYFFWRKK
jgi:APA family basic amino acid/polyamine antiporter